MASAAFDSLHRRKVFDAVGRPGLRRAGLLEFTTCVVLQISVPLLVPQIKYGGRVTKPLDETLI